MTVPANAIHVLRPRIRFSGVRHRFGMSPQAGNMSDNTGPTLTRTVICGLPGTTTNRKASVHYPGLDQAGDAFSVNDGARKQPTEPTP